MTPARLISTLLLAACSTEPPSTIGDIETLTPDQGFTIHLTPFQVPPGTEVQDCYFVRVPDLAAGEDLWIDRFKIGQRDGSHHMNVFRVKTIVNLDPDDGTDVTLGDLPAKYIAGGECRISTNWSDWPLVTNSQQSSPIDPVYDWQLPDGVAQRFTPGELLMVQTHYVNATEQVTPADGEVKVNFYRSVLADPIEMGTLFATQQNIRICRSAPAPTFDGACSFPAGSQTHVAAANGHFHARGKQFSIYGWDGTTPERPASDALIYQSESWDEPDMATGLDAVVPPGGGIWWSCEYQWREPGAGCDEVNRRDGEQEGDCCYTFGNSAESAEHCNVFLYYWPKVDNSDVFCN
ncbi:MAG TPA: hypothetical protein VIU61_07995 [Kofleriaceae bacterium]